MHKEFTDKLNLKDVANEFVGVAECWLSLYGQFKYYYYLSSICRFTLYTVAWESHVSVVKEDQLEISNITVMVQSICLLLKTSKRNI